MEINEPEKAISDFSVWIQNNPNDPEGYRGRGTAFYNSGNHPNAISDFSMAIKKGCCDNQIYKMRSKSYAMVGEKNKAEADLATANFLKTSDKKPNFLKLSYLKIIAIIAFSVFLGLSIAVFIFFPERLPSGIGLNLLPLDVYSRKSLIGEGRVIFIKNSSQKSLKNLSIYLSSKSRNLEKSLFRESLEPEGFLKSDGSKDGNKKQGIL